MQKSYRFSILPSSFIKSSKFLLPATAQKSEASGSPIRPLLQLCLLSGLAMLGFSTLHYLTTGGIGNILGSLAWSFLSLVFGISGWGIWEAEPRFFKNYLASFLLIVGIPIIGVANALIYPHSFWMGWQLSFGGLILCVSSSVLILAMFEWILLVGSMASLGIFGFYIWKHINFENVKNIVDLFK